MPTFSNHLQRIHHNARNYRPELLDETVKRAAVAAVLRHRGETTDILFIRRSHHPKDPWSGQMAFPGGRVDTVDSNPLQTALRETQEEIHLDLIQHSRLVTPLSHLNARARGRFPPLVIEPYLFDLRGDPTLNLSEEVDETLWIPLDFFLEPANRSRFSWKGPGTSSLILPCYHYGERRIWGLTLQMLDEILNLTIWPADCGGKGVGYDHSPE